MTRFIGFAAVVILAVGCSQSNQPPGEVSKSTTPVSFNAAGAPIVEFTVPDMMCPDGCGEKVKEILAEQPGAKEVLVDFPAKTVTVAIDEEKFDATQAVAALKDHQFDQSALKSAAADAPIAAPQSEDAKSVQ